MSENPGYVMMRGVAMQQLWQAIGQHPLAAVLVVIDIASAGFYAHQPHWGRVVYWLCAAGITAAATWGME